MLTAGDSSGGSSNSSDDTGSIGVDQDGVLNVYFSILLVVHAAVLVVVAYIQRPWRLVSCCCSPAAKYRNQAAAAEAAGLGCSAAATAGSRSSSSRSSSGYGDNSFDMVIGGSTRMRRY